MLSSQENVARLESLSAAAEIPIAPAKLNDAVQTHTLHSAFAGQWGLVQTASRAASLPAAATSPPPFDPSNFVAGVTNEYFPLQSGATYIYEGESAEGHELDRFAIMRNTVMIAGVECIEVRDNAYVDGELVERTRDWFAQDKDGNVWYFGEATEEIENGEVVSTKGSWVAGKDGAQPGFIMLAEPEGGETYGQEFAPGIAEDKATVLGDEFHATTVYGNFNEVLKTKDFTPLEPGKLEYKFYAEGVGQILTINPITGTRTDLTRIEFNGTAGNDSISGKLGTDVLRGLDGNDTLAGLDGNDRLIGGKGNDILKGGNGDDRLTGDLGRDTFVFSGLADGKHSTDVITDYHRSEGDRIDLGAGGAAKVEAELFVNGAWQLLLKGDGDTVRLIGVADANHNGHIVDELLFV